MTVTWERFAGRTDKFAIRLSLLADPDDGEGARPEDAASWGSFQLWVENRNLCAHVDQGEVLAAAHWYLLPLAEWLTENWNALLHEERLPITNSADTGVVSLELHRVPPPLGDDGQVAAWEQEFFDWRSRHALRSARDGGLFPNIVLRRLRDYVEVSWDSASEVGVPEGFEFSAGRGSALLEPHDVAGPLHEVLAAFVDALVPERDPSPRLVALRNRVGMLASPGQNDARLSWMVGRAGGADEPRLWSRVRESLTGDADAVAAALHTEETALVVDRAAPAALLFASVSPEITADDLRTLSGVLIDQYAPITEPRLAGLVDDVPIDDRRRAWEQGYELAEALYDDHDLDTTAGWFDIEGFLGDLDVWIVQRSLSDTSIAACSIVGPQHVPTVLLNRTHRAANNQAARRFTLAHELCHLLYDRARGARLALASGPWAPRQIEQRARAFAAMLLLPPHVIESTLARLHHPIASVDGVTELAATVRVSKLATVRHLANMALLSETEAEALLRELRE